MNRNERIAFKAAGYAARMSMRSFSTGIFVAAVLSAGIVLGQAPVARAQEKTPGLDRTVLPIPEPSYPPVTELDVRKATAPPRFEVKAPNGAPNVVLVLIDDLGFAGTRKSFKFFAPTTARSSR